jgi:hypothetical protein
MGVDLTRMGVGRDAKVVDLLAKEIESTFVSFTKTRWKA